MSDTVSKKNKMPTVKLVGNDGNAFSILGACSKAWRMAGNDPKEWDAISKEMMSGDYDNLLAAACKYFNVR